jgi:hypothetical protein
MVAAMPEPIDLLDRLPPRPSPLEKGRIDEPIAPFLSSDVDSFEAWALRANYEAGNPPLSSDDLSVLRRAWQK